MTQKKARNSIYEREWHLQRYQKERRGKRGNFPCNEAVADCYEKDTAVDETLKRLGTE